MSQDLVDEDTDVLGSPSRIAWIELLPPSSGRGVFIHRLTLARFDFKWYFSKSSASTAAAISSSDTFGENPVQRYRSISTRRCSNALSRRQSSQGIVCSHTSYSVVVVTLLVPPHARQESFRTTCFARSS